MADGPSVGLVAESQRDRGAAAPRFGGVPDGDCQVTDAAPGTEPILAVPGILSPRKITVKCAPSGRVLLVSPLRGGREPGHFAACRVRGLARRTGSGSPSIRMRFAWRDVRCSMFLTCGYLGPV